MRDVVVMKEYLPKTEKKPRLEPYHEEKKKITKPAEKTPEPYSAAIIEKKPVLNSAAKAWQALPQRKIQEKRKAPQKQEPKTSVDKPVGKPTENAGAKEKAREDSDVNEAVDDKDSEKAPLSTKPTATPNSEGQYELGEPMSTILHDELQQIMIKVWQELPDSPPSEAEQLVANRFRNEAGDDLQNAMGLSVTTRLLNVHNPLYAKLQFSCKPESGCLQAFIRKYNITAFKRIADASRDLFAAKFDDIASFDRLCVHSQINCGSAKVSITPCYKYLSCPPAIKTIYAVKEKNKEAAKMRTNSSSQKYSDSNKTEKRAQSVEFKTKDNEMVKKVNTVTDKSEPKTQAIQTATDAIAKDASNTGKSPEKTNEVPNTNTVKTPVKCNEVPNTDKAQEKSKEANAPTGPNVISKTVENKVDKKTNLSYASGKQTKSGDDDDDDMMVLDEMGEEDDEEMTDQDILALMSGGIVLDECSGSDEEK